MFDKPHEECGVFVIYNKKQFNAVHLTYLALYALQHRGQISCGIALNRGGVVAVSYTHLDVYKRQNHPIAP